MVDFVSEIKQVKKKLEELKTIKKIKEQSLSKAQQGLITSDALLMDTLKARVIIQKVASDMQKNLEFRITNIVTMALASVFSDPYEFKVEFVERRNQTECDMFFVKDGNSCDPMDSSGGGAIDIASLALRMAIWSIKKTRAIQILDEPSKFLSRDMQAKASEMLKMLSEQLGIQMIVVSHIPELIESADRVINIENIQGYSSVKLYRGT